MKKRYFFLTIPVVLICAVVINTVIRDEAFAANVQETSEKIQVFIGDMGTMSQNQANEYYEMQTELLEAGTESFPSNSIDALITFDDFLPEEEVTNILGGDAFVKEIYLWTPGETGKAIILVENNDVTLALQSYFERLNQRIANPSPDVEEEYLDLLEKVKSEHGIFAVLIQNTYQNLSDIVEEEHVVQVDLLYSEYAQRMSAESNKEIEYICIPTKPDNTK